MQHGPHPGAGFSSASVKREHELRVDAARGAGRAPAARERRASREPEARGAAPAVWYVGCRQRQRSAPRAGAVSHGRMIVRRSSVRAPIIDPAPGVD